MDTLLSLNYNPNQHPVPDSKHSGLLRALYETCITTRPGCCWRRERFLAADESWMRWSSGLRRGGMMQLSEPPGFRAWALDPTG